MAEAKGEGYKKVDTEEYQSKIFKHSLSAGTMATPMEAFRDSSAAELALTKEQRKQLERSARNKVTGEQHNNSKSGMNWGAVGGKAALGTGALLQIAEGY